MSVNSARQEVQELYKSLQPMAKDILSKYSKEIDNIIKKIKDNMTTLTNQEIQIYMLSLSIEAAEFAERKDMALLMQECSLAILKEKQAETFNGSIGTQVVRTNESIIQSKENQVVNMLYNAVANSMKSKLDEAHRIVNILSNILISKNAENKLKGATDYDGNLYSNGVPDNRPGSS